MFPAHGPADLFECSQRLWSPFSGKTPICNWLPGSGPTCKVIFLEISNAKQHKKSCCKTNSFCFTLPSVLKAVCSSVCSLNDTGIFACKIIHLSCVTHFFALWNIVKSKEAVSLVIFAESAFKTKQILTEIFYIIIFWTFVVCLETFLYFTYYCC